MSINGKSKSIRENELNYIASIWSQLTRWQQLKMALIALIMLRIRKGGLQRFLIAIVDAL